MFKAFAIVALAFSALVNGQSSLTIASPASLVQCQPVALSWSGGTPPYILAVIPGGQTSAPALETINDALSGTSTTWTVNLAAGTTVTFKITDNTGVSQYSSQLTIQQGSSSSCINATATSAAGAAGATGASGSVSAASGATGASSAAVGGASSSAMVMSSSAAATSAMMSSSMAGSMSMMSSSMAASMTSSSTPTSSMAASSSAASAAASASKSGAASKGSHIELTAAALAALGGLAALL